MNDFTGLFPSDFGLKPQGKSAPMAPPAKPYSNSSSGSNFDLHSHPPATSAWTSTPIGSSFDHSSSFADSKSRDSGTKFDDVFVSDTTKRGNKSNDDVFNFDWSVGEKSTAPVYDKPIYDDDIFDGVPGLKNTSPANYVDVFASISSPPKEDAGFDDLLASLGRTAQGSQEAARQRSEESEAAMSGFDDLIPGFGVSGPSGRSSTSDVGRGQETEVPKGSSKMTGDPFVVLESTSTSPPPVSSPQDSHRTRNDHVSASGVDNSSNSQKPPARGPDKPFCDSSSARRWESQQTIFEEPTASKKAYQPVGGYTGSPPHASSSKKNAQDDISSRSGENLNSSDDVWLTVSDIPLFTPVTTAPPPSRPPPPKPVRISKTETVSLDSKIPGRNVNEFNSFLDSTHHVHSSGSVHASERNSTVFDADELENFATGRQHKAEDGVGSFSDNKGGINYAAASAAAMKEAMDRAEAKFRQVRERENVKGSRNKEAMSWEKDDKVPQDDGQESAPKEKQEQFEREQQQTRREEEEREQKRLEKERERAREIEREREKARQAVERATREARERAAIEARQKAERAAVEKANAEARERAGRLAVQRVQAEARERAAKDAKERAQKAAVEARDREIREKAVAAKAAAEARERAASAAKKNQQSTENDVESFFGMGSRPSSAPRARANSSEPVFDAQFQSKQSPEVSRTSHSVSSSMRKASSTTNIVDDLSSIFGAPPSGEFQEVEGESEDRRRARLERHQRTQERAAKALAEKNERDIQNQREQAERHRIAETLDTEIKRWAAGKQGNLRALLSTLQYVLWPESGWQPVSLTDLITATSVKKVYRKATLCVHPDKVQQKGATLQQKYIAEKVFDLLKEAWNKFNSEELF